ncbi:hypothetical protein AQUCO_01500351v1 [Aquilegia coerulea]|uniref:Glycosyltransferase family 92 protein n=1 Tax=Aquilegia coerulea TaxID=218851 RepID=A0A2G5DTA4_AQUCA|nr:hypothetical protein AQUCO_01500351v1 [Aquilegia coerulea]
MRRKPRTTLLILITIIILFAFFSLNLNLFSTSNQQIIFPKPTTTLTNHKPNSLLLSIKEEDHLIHRHVISSPSSSSLFNTNPDSILLPDWEILLIIPSSSSSSSIDHDQFTCVFQNNYTSPAKLAGILPFNNRQTFKCILPFKVRRLRPFYSPILTTTSSPVNNSSSPIELFRWRFLTYESISTETDVILFVKGVNNRQGVNRLPQDLNCVFFNAVNNNSVKTAVISSNQEVFRCHHPYQKNIGEENVKVSLEIVTNVSFVIPSVAYYTPLQRNVVEREEKLLICACTMVYNVAKFLKEWVIYSSKIGVEKFLLYDNGSDDDVEKVVNELREKGYHVDIIYWPWSKTQEAGFSHCATYANDTCTWMMYIDVDEFIYSPSWLNSSSHSRMLKSLLPRRRRRSSHPIGQIMIKCYEFGPSNQNSHPINGVIQGYTCRSRIEQRHKSIVLLDAIDISLLNVIHHFQLKKGYRVKKLSLDEGVVNHYKYQAWSEFKTKFRRRVSAYVVDWKQGVNPKSKDRTPGLGFEPVEPKGWAKRFCDVHDYRLQEATRRWFGLRSGSEYKMSWNDL